MAARPTSSRPAVPIRWLRSCPLAMALEHVDRTDLAALVEGAVDRTLDAGSVTPDLGGKLSTREATDALIAEIEAAA